MSTTERVHPMLRLVVAHPHLLGEHVSAYAQLLSEEGSAVAARLRRQAGARCVGLASVSVAGALTGVALMLWAALPAAAMRQPWLLVVVPLLALVPAAWAWAVARKEDAATGFALLRGQIDADLALLRQVHRP